MCVCVCVCVWHAGGCDSVIPVNRPHTIRLDTSRAGAGHVTCDVIAESGSVIHAAAAADNGDNNDVQEVTYTPTVSQIHHVRSYFGGQPIPHGHFVQQVTNSVTVSVSRRFRSTSTLSWL